MRLYTLTPLILTLALAIPAAAQAPIIAKTEAGQTVLLYPDGTWKYEGKTPASTPSPKGHIWSPLATDKLVTGQGKVVIHFDPNKWKKDVKAQEPGTNTFTHKRGDGYAKVICERIQIPLARSCQEVCKRVQAAILVSTSAGRCGRPFL